MNYTKNPNDAVARKAIYDKYDKPITEAIREAKQVETPAPQEKESKGLPKATSNFEALDVIDYTKPELNKYKPSEQLKFNQGTYEPVRLVGDEDLIKFIQAGSERSIKLDGRVKKANKISQQFVDKKQKEFGITAIEAYERAKEIAKANRDVNTERIVVLGDKISQQEEVALTEIVQPKSEEQATIHRETGGSTFTVDGTNRNGTKAGSVSIFPERTKIVEGELTKEDIDTYVKENSDIYSGNGDVLAVGAPEYDSSCGCIYIYTSISKGSFVYKHTLLPELDRTPTIQPRFGEIIAISDDARTFVTSSKTNISSTTTNTLTWTFN
jgi:hypothetical protein